jgi:type II secretory pathway predicted ATPase ExeA
MYESHFGFRQRPFRSTPNPEYYYPATGHEQALADVLMALRDEEGLAVLIGAPGMGKTLLCHCLLERLGPDITVSFLTNSHVADRTSLLQAVLYDLSLPYLDRTEQELRLALTDFLLNNYSTGKRAVLVFDEAQNLPAEILEELRLLGNLEGRNGKAVQIVLSAQPRFLETLEETRVEAFNQRVALRARLYPLDVHEAADYLVHQLRAAGAQPEKVMTDEALDILARATKGVPRLLNRAAHQALCLAHAAESDCVDAEAALEALALLDLCVEDASAEPALEESEECGRDGEARIAPAAESSEESGDKGAGRLRRLFAPPRRPAG